MILIISEMIILIVIVLIVRVIKHVYRLCDFNNLQMPDSYAKQNCCPIRMLGNKSDIFLEISSITNVSSIRIHIGTTMGYPTQFFMSGKPTKGDIEYHTFILYDEINFDWSKIEYKYHDEPIFFPSTIKVPLHGKFKTRKLLTCLDPQYRIVIQCQNIVYILNEHEIVQPKLRLLQELSNRNDYNINNSQSDIVEELIHVETDAIMLNEGACKSGQPDKILESKQNENENVTQTEVQIEPRPHSLRKIKCTHCKNYVYM